jgi:hypothetical protein
VKCTKNLTLYFGRNCLTKIDSRPKPVIEYDDDDEYYYVYDDEYYDVALPPRKLPSHRKHKDNKNKKPSYPAKFSSR